MPKSELNLAQDTENNNANALPNNPAVTNNNNNSKKRPFNSNETNIVKSKLSADECLAKKRFKQQQQQQQANQNLSIDELKLESEQHSPPSSLSSSSSSSSSSTSNSSEKTSIKKSKSKLKLENDSLLNNENKNINLALNSIAKLNGDDITDSAASRETSKAYNGNEMVLLNKLNYDHARLG